MALPPKGEPESAATPEVTADAVASHVKALLFNPRAPELAPDLAEVPDVPEIHEYLMEMRRQLTGYSKGDFSREITLRGMLAGTVKSLQANMQHLLWQMQQVEKGDFSQRVDFMGEFSLVFNKMVKQLDDALTSLRIKEEELVRMAADLKLEVEKRGAALAVLQKSEENLKYLAEHDPLTGLLNRRSFFARAEMELARSSILDTPGCIALMDVDRFKDFNDSYGHLNGDAALRHIAEIGSHALREGDIMGRYGGEEFVYFFSKAGPEQAFNAAERIRKLIAETPVTLLEGSKVNISASFGVVSIPPSFMSAKDINLMETAIFLADVGLYRAKSEGRNQVCLEPFHPSLPTGSSCRLQVADNIETTEAAKTGDKVAAK